MSCVKEFFNKLVPHEFTDYCATGGDYVWTEQIPRIEHWWLKIKEISFYVLIAVGVVLVLLSRR